VLRGQLIAGGLTALVLFLTGVFLTVPFQVDADIELTTLRSWLTSHGLAGILGFSLIYVLLVLMLVPGAAVTLAAGALFGPLTGFLVVAFATSVADAVAFILARYVAREAVVTFKRRHPRFQAFDHALENGGWRIVALLRLNPAIPYSASNYLFGISGVRFLPYLVASGVFTLPGAFVYTYLGYVGAETIGGETRNVIEWGVLVLGLSVTVLTVIYVTILARRALTGIETGPR